MKGKVYLVGSGPGDPELLTIKARRLIGEADVILYDRLVNPEILNLSKKEAKRVFVGKAPGSHTIDQESINNIIASEAENNSVVVRLKGGDPFVLGRGGEEARALRKRKIPFEIVPGVTSAIAVPEAAGIPITDRAASSSFTIVSGHRAKGRTGPEIDFSKIESDTVVILMGLGNIEQIVEQLKKKRDEKMPVAVIEQGTTMNERTVIGTLGDIVEKVKDMNIRAPTVIVVGDVVNLRREITGE